MLASVLALAGMLLLAIFVRQRSVNALRALA